MDQMHSVIQIAWEHYVALVKQVSVCLWEAQMYILSDLLAWLVCNNLYSVHHISYRFNRPLSQLFPLAYPDGSKKTLWLPDATIDYFTNKHAVLFFIAILILLAGIIYTLLLFLWQWFLWCPRK